MRKLTKDKHSSLLRKFVNYGQEKFYNTGPGTRLAPKAWKIVAKAHW